MRLLELKTGEEGAILGVKGSGVFRHRIMEMGFVKGKHIKVVKNAPLKDPIEYSIMGYHVSLRRSEAELIEIDTIDGSPGNTISNNNPLKAVSQRQFLGLRKKTIDVAFIGNPNSGKTSIFNFASYSNEHTGNYSGVTVDSKTTQLIQDGYLFKITDLPGSYSLSAFSPEELFVRDFIIDQLPDVIVNVIDVSNLERNLYLTTQLIDLDIKVVIALNMYDELEKRGDTIDFALLGRLIGIPIMPTVGSRGRGVHGLFRKIINVYNDTDPIQRHIQINYSDEIEQSIKKIQTDIEGPEHCSLTDRISSRFIAIKLLEHDRNIERYIHNSTNYKQIIEDSHRERKRIELLYRDDATSIITSEKYGFISGAIRETYVKGIQKVRVSTEVIDGYLTNRVFGLPFFILFMMIMFSATFTLGKYPQHWIGISVGMLGDWLNNTMDSGSLKDLLINGIIGGVGGVIVFLPNILILFLFISFMEDSGYMARAVFIMDKLMHKIGLHGKSFIPLIMGFGCNVPAIMATRTIEDRNNKLLTILINPFMSCSARLPVYLLLIGAIFPVHQGIFLFLLYFIGVSIAIGVALLFKKTLFKSESTSFVMELPPYRLPTLRSILKHMWFKGSYYLKKMGGVILIASILLWALGYFPRNFKNIQPSNSQITHLNKFKAVSKKNSEVIFINFNDTVTMNANKNLENNYESLRIENSYIGRLGKLVEPVLQPLGFNWKMGVSLISGIAAKEIVVSTLGVLHQVEIHDANNDLSLSEKLKNQVYTSGKMKDKRVFSPLATLSFLLFILIYFPCIAVFAAVKKESGSIWWAVFMVSYTTVLAYIVSFLVYQIGNIFVY